MRPFGYLHLSPPAKMAACLLMNVVQLLGHGRNQCLWPCKCHFVAEHCLFSQMHGAHGSWLQGATSHLISRRCQPWTVGWGAWGDAMAHPSWHWAMEVPWHGRPAGCRVSANVSHREHWFPCSGRLWQSWDPSCKTNTFQQGRVTNKILVTFLLPEIKP